MTEGPATAKKAFGERVAGAAMGAFKSSGAYSALFEGVGISEEECRNHLAALHDVQPHQETVFAHNYLYSCLSILDSKAHGLLTYDSIVLAAASLVLTIFARTFNAGSVLIFIALVCSAFAASLCLYVIWIYWTETADFQKSDGLFVELLKVRNRRTIAYRLSWLISQLAMVLLVLGVIIERAV
jgi:hypothetical protein